MCWEEPARDAGLRDNLMRRSGVHPCEGWEDTVRLIYLATAGTEDPTRASIPLHLAANGSLEVGQETAIVLAGDATELVLDDRAQQIEGLGVPPARELLAKLRDHAVPIYV